MRDKVFVSVSGPGGGRVVVTREEIYRAMAELNRPEVPVFKGGDRVRYAHQDCVVVSLESANALRAPEAPLIVGERTIRTAVISLRTGVALNPKTDQLVLIEAGSGRPQRSHESVDGEGC